MGNGSRRRPYRRGFVAIAQGRSCAGFSDAGMTMPTTRTVAGVREAPRHEIAGSGHRRCGVRYRVYMSGGTVKPDFWALSLSCILLFDLKSPFFRPDPGVCGARRARSVKDGAIAPPSGLVLD